MVITSVARSVSTASSCVAATCATCSRTESHTAASPDTTLTPKTARWSLSCSATSAIETLEARAHPIAELLHDAPLVLQRARVRDVEREAKDADEHHDCSPASISSFCLISSTS